MIKTIQQGERTFKVINSTPDNIMQSFLEATQHEEDSKAFTSILSKLGGGACGDVYTLGEDYVVKVNNGNSRFSSIRDGDVLADLQGLPLVPTIYAYSTDNKFCLIQKIHGVTVGELNSYKNKTVKITSFDEKNWIELAHEFYNGSITRGWTPNDLHMFNCMVDKDNKLWVVDFGLFKDVNEGNYGDFDDLLCHIETIASSLEPSEVIPYGERMRTNPIFIDWSLLKEEESS